MYVSSRYKIQKNQPKPLKKPSLETSKTLATPYKKPRQRANNTRFWSTGVFAKTGFYPAGLTLRHPVTRCMYLEGELLQRLAVTIVGHC